MSTRSIETGNLGFPRIGLHRELKFALERFWAGEWNAGQLETAGRKVRGERWQLQAASGIHHIPSNDFSLYDHVLDTAVLAGAIPTRYRDGADAAGLATYFAMARGSHSVPAMEMTKWFDTNYHYVVPEFEPGMTFRAVSRKPVEEFLEARELGLATRPVLLGPVSFVLLGKTRDAHLDRSNLGIALGEVYAQVLNELASAGAAWVQIDEPYLGLDLAAPYRRLFSGVYEASRPAYPASRSCLQPIFRNLARISTSRLGCLSRVYIWIWFAPRPVVSCTGAGAGRLAAVTGCSGWAECLAHRSRSCAGDDPEGCGPPRSGAYSDRSFVLPDARTARP